MSAPALSKISHEDLTRFLDDIHKNIAHDDETDFEKLILYVFGFANAKLELILRDTKRGEAPPTEDLELLERLLNTIHEIFSKRKHLLNIEISPEKQQKLKIVSASGHDTPSSPDIMYEWAIKFALSWLPQFPQHHVMTNLIKSFIIGIINLIAVQLHNFRYKNSLKVKLLQILNQNLSSLLESISSINNPQDFLQFHGPQLSCSIHLYTIVNDFDISSKLLLNLPQYQLKLESIARKCWFLLDSVDFNIVLESSTDDPIFKLVDNLRSTLLLNLTNNLILNDSTCWDSVSLLLKWITDHLKTFNTIATDSTPLTYSYYLTTFNRSISYSLLRIFQFCRDKSILPSFFNFLQLHTFPVIFIQDETELIQCNRTFPQILLKTLHVIYFQYNFIQDNPDATNIYTTVKADYISQPILDEEINSLRAAILNYDPNDYYKVALDLLDFIVLSEFKYENFQTKSPATLAVDKFDFPRWLQYIKYIIDYSFKKKNFKILSDRPSFYSFITAMGHFPCLLNHDFNISVGECSKCGGSLMKKNFYDNISPFRKSVTDGAELSVFYNDIICNFILGHRLNDVRSDPLTCCNFLLTVFKIFASFAPPRTPLIDDTTFKFVFQCISHHPSRNVRLLAARILPLYLIQPKDGTLDSHFAAIFSGLSQIRFDSDSKKIHLAESTIRALSELAIISEGEWLCVILIKLADIFNEDNEQHVNLAYDGFLYIAANKRVTPYKLLSPFLSNISERIVQRSRSLMKISELLGISKNAFLQRTREFTTPMFLEYYKHDYIQEIAVASNMTKWKLIQKNLPRILATYLVRNETIDERYILSVLGNVSPEYRNVSMADLMTSIGNTTWFILLKISVNDKGEITNEERINQALMYVAKMNLSVAGDPKTRKRVKENKIGLIEYLLGEHVLELVQRFSETVHHIQGTSAFLDKLSSLKAIEYLIKKNVDAAASALGQISTCLQATLENPDFELPAIRCWNVLIQKLQIDHLISLFDIIISLIFQRFNSLEHRSKLIAVEIITKLFHELKNNYKKYGCYYFSIPFIQNLDQFYTVDPALANSLKAMGKIRFFSEFTRRLKTSNKYVVQQALDDLIIFTSKYQSICQTEDFKDPLLERSISDMIRTIFDTAVHFKNKVDKISTSCAKALSVIGALDANKFNFKTIKNRIVIIHDFNDYKEIADFLRHFMETIVIKVFWASNDPSKQLFSAYVMQKFLEILKLDVKVLDSTTQDFFTEVWNGFNDEAKSTLTPLLSSRYVAPDPKYEPLQFPYYRPSMKHERWLADFTSNLLKRPVVSFLREPVDESSRSVIFKTCSLLIRDPDISICHYLLKYVALSHIINGDEEVMNNIRNEFLSILSTETHSSFSSDRLESLRSCYQSIFEVLDYFNEWVSCVTQYLSDTHLSKSETSRLKTNVKFVNKFLSKIPTKIIAIRSAECNSYERTILYLEKCYRDGEGTDADRIDDLSIVTTLQSMYSSINDFDALDGILKKFSTNNLKEKLTTFQYNENWSLAQESFQVLSEVGSQQLKIESNTKLLKSLSDHALYDEVLSTLSSKVNIGRPSDIPMEWSMVGLQAAVVSGDINQINKWLFVSDSCGKAQGIETLITYKFAQGLKELYDSNSKGFTEQMEGIYKVIGQSLVSSMSSSFSRNSILMNQLHSIYDVSLIASPDAGIDGKLESEYEQMLRDRLVNVDQGFDSQWKILSMHRVANMAMKKLDKISDILLFCSKVARKNERLDIATRCIMKTMALDDQEANVEYAELLWAQGKQTEAIKSLSQIISDNLFKNDHQKASAQLKYAIWLDESNHSSSSTIIKEYSEAYKLEPRWEKPYYDLGKYFNKILESRADFTGYYELQIIRNFLKSLALVPTFIFEALPKFITIWLDFAQRTKKGKDTERKESERKLNQIIIDIKNFCDRIPVYVWYTSITQMLSRINHTHSESAQLLQHVLSQIAQAYPKHSLWYILSHLNSNEKVRKERVAKVLSEVQSSSSGLSNNVLGAKELFSTLISIANFKISKRGTSKMSLSRDFKVTNLSVAFDSLVIPVRSNLEIRLPTMNYHYNSAFPRSSSITFDGFDDVVNIFHSLQMPRQLTVRGTDARPYRLMVKKDDTRKDAKVVEFTTMINRLLTASTEARKRNLSIPNYAVIPLAENMGVIEFVQDVATMKSVVIDTQKKLGHVVNERSLFHKLGDAQKLVKASFASNTTPAANLTKLFEKVCNENPPVLHKWFIDQFSDPTSWYMARSKFTRSAAVMSMVGYIIGLGDRHCENILIFKKTGAVLHIDFDCLFDKGLVLPTPEIVPFRLTQNLIDAMGISGIEGAFRIACEVTASLLRENEAPLMNILETLLYDPLLDWKTHQNPQEHLRKVRRKIRGLVDEKEGLPMNIHGQVDVLIQEASSTENLSKMYPGWGAYL